MAILALLNARITALQSAPLKLEVATPERIALALPVAGIGFRSIAYLVDALVLFFFWVAAYFFFSLLVSDFLGAFLSLSGAGKTFAVLGAFATQWLFWTCCEVFWRGQTPGKRLIGIRVVSDDGSAVSVLQSAVRNLCRIVDFLPVFYAFGLMTMLITRENRRLGDLLAGTILVREDRIDLAKYQPPPLARSEIRVPAGAPALSTSDAELILSYLQRAPELGGDPRMKLAAALIERYGGPLSADERRAVTATQEAAEAFLRLRVQAGV
ncbi:MAG TPA: RDD family protein [Myxococcaceae bacterium]|nr:RDD family protein [Myxococcaceae bacterium]